MEDTTFSIRIFNQDHSNSVVFSFEEKTDGVHFPDATLSGLLDASKEIAQLGGLVSSEGAWWNECGIPQESCCGETWSYPCKIWNTPSGLAFQVEVQ